eukprot:424816_1
MQGVGIDRKIVTNGFQMMKAERQTGVVCLRIVNLADPRHYVMDNRDFGEIYKMRVQFVEIGDGANVTRDCTGLYQFGSMAGIQKDKFDLGRKGVPSTDCFEVIEESVPFVGVILIGASGIAILNDPHQVFSC